MSSWPRIESTRDHETLAVLHLASQMLGKIRVAHAPWVNHGWHATLRPTAAGLATLPTATPDGRSFVLTLDLCRHGIGVQVSNGGSHFLAFGGKTIAQLHGELVTLLERYGLPSSFHGRPNEIASAIRFVNDAAPRRYNEDSATRFHQALQVIVPVFERFRAGFRGKCSPVHFFWGSFDLAVTRFSGRTAPQHSGGVPGLPDRITREAYSHEVSSAGWWAGGVTQAEPFFYSYAYPEPPSFRERPLTAGGWNGEVQEFVLPYDDVGASVDPESMLSTFFDETYAAAADLADWDRAALEREPVAP